MVSSEDDERGTKSSDPSMKDQPPPPSSSPLDEADAGTDTSSSLDPTDTTPAPTLRTQLGIGLSAVSDTINSNLIVVRYATISSIFLLGAYGVANTPLFYRYKHVMDIPAGMFLRRKWIYGRIVGVVENDSTNNVNVRVVGGRQAATHASGWSDASAAESASKKSNMGLASLLSSSLQKASESNADFESFTTNTNTLSTPEQPVVVLFRHSSPMERLLTQSAMDNLLSITGKSPSRLLYSSANPHRNLLPIELAGIAAPPSSSSRASSLGISMGDQQGNQLDLLQQLVQQKARVSLQLLAQRTVKTDKVPSYHHDHDSDRNKTNDRALPIKDEMMSNTAICHLHYKQQSQWFTTTNAGLELVKRGQALVSSLGMVVPLSTIDNTTDTKPSKDDNENKNTTAIINFNPTVKQLQNDTDFIAELEQSEYSAWKSKVGMWSSSRMRDLRTEYKEEEEYNNNKWSTSVWKMVKKGLSWIRSR